MWVVYANLCLWGRLEVPVLGAETLGVAEEVGTTVLGIVRSVWLPRYLRLLSTRSRRGVQRVGTCSVFTGYQGLHTY